MYRLVFSSAVLVGILLKGFVPTAKSVDCTTPHIAHANCTEGCYGKLCNISCVNCDDEGMDKSCNKTTGVCNKCHWKKYGLYCNKSCPTGCQKGEDCDRNNGSCSQCKEHLSDAPPYTSYCNESDAITSIAATKTKVSTSKRADGGGFSLSSMSTQRTENSTSSTEGVSSDSPSIYYVILPIVGFVVLIATILVLCRRKRKRPKQEKVSMRRNEEKEHLMEDKSDSSIRRRDIERGPNSVYNMRGSVALLTEIDHDKPIENIPEPKPVSSDYFNVRFFKIPVKGLDETVERMKSEEKIVKEFADLPTGLLEMFDESTKKEIMQRNRYKGIYPYNHSRVKLDEEKHGDVTYPSYINACFVHGFKKENAYIAAQGPFTPDTVIDFWRMTWQYDIKQIVMLTNLIEGSTIKCLRYWPQDEDDFGPLHVKTEDEELYESHAVRTFQLQKGEEKRSVTQFHFTAWPDKGVPDDVMSVLNFREEVVKHCNYEEHGPMIVHCSAGIGRTGTFIALDYLLREGSSGPKIDVINCVSKMRQQRVCVIQTLEQYVFLYDSLVEGLKDVKISDVQEEQEVNPTSVNASGSLKSKGMKPLPVEPVGSEEDQLDKEEKVETVIDMNGIHPPISEGANTEEITKL